MPVSPQGKVVVVVGASSGIGRATARLFAAKGAFVMAAARRENLLIELRDESRNDGHSLDIHVSDATRPADMEQLAHRTLEVFGKVDFLIYASGTNTPDRTMARLNANIWNT